MEYLVRLAKVGSGVPRPLGRLIGYTHLTKWRELHHSAKQQLCDQIGGIIYGTNNATPKTHLELCEGKLWPVIPV